MAQNKLFGTNGVRGIANRDFTVDLVTKLAASSGSYLGKQIAVGRDGRVTSIMFRDAVIAGLLSVGCNVHDLGSLPTPALQYGVKHFGLDGGLMITASHNPPEFNGIKVMGSDGVEVSREQETEIENIYHNNGLELASWDNIGSVFEKNALQIYKDTIVTHVDSEAIQAACLKIAVDPGNGVAAHVAPDIASCLGCSVYTVNVDVDGTFPGRSSEPRPDNLKLLVELVKASGADLGIGFDGDGDRAIFVDEKGDVHWGDRSFALVVKDFMTKNPGSKVATPVSSSQVISDVVSDFGGTIVWTEVGSVVVSRVMVNEGISLGGEENGGIMYGPHIETRDGSIAMVLILEIMAKTGKTLSQLFGELPQYFQSKVRVSCPNELKSDVLRKLVEKADAPEVETIDGVKLKYTDGSWALVRPSGTEPIFRIYSEAINQVDANVLANENKSKLEAIIEELTE